ncbi:DUF1405 domain-containing protein [Paenibacillus sp. HB172176]|uniref:DUF1405 domain-containing protein n=1 Tax=Paenibacillus sp. HB172176 TaxID=2493690 RepID=UPI00143A823F|nr:DUF1405 domain-containing protein [Paenibacillus sp. HB172176]
MNLGFFLSKSFLLNRKFLWLLFVFNVAGTVYGYIWYGNQLEWTAANKPAWMLPFVPDSPTSSLFFSIAILYFLFPLQRANKLATAGRAVIEALAIVCSVKYGVWAVSMIVAGTWLGDSLPWTSIMLVVSHLAMAVESILYFRFMTAGIPAIVVSACWLLLNDVVDYTQDVYPWLSRRLTAHLETVKAFTFSLSIISILIASLVARLRWKA